MKVKGGAKRRTLVNGTDGVPATCFDGTDSVENATDGDVSAAGGFVIGGEGKGWSAEDVVVAAAEGCEEEVEEDEDEGEEDGEGEEEEEEEEELEEEEEDDVEQRPKLAEGFYEIEAVRRKRVRKGEVQYLIKCVGAVERTLTFCLDRRGWPETANTWEPLENLSYCVDVVEAFEERLMSGKSRSSRKRKRKNVPPHIQPKKKQRIQHSRSDEIPSQKDSTVLEDVVPLQSVRFGLSAAMKSDASRDVVSEQSTENGSRRSFQRFNVREEESDYDPKLSELRGTACSNGFPRDSSTTNVQEAKNSGGSGSAGTPSIDSIEPVQSARRVGSRRRKPDSVKRFKQEMVSESSIDQNRFGTTAYNMNPELSNSKTSPIITKIIKPIGFSASIANSIQDVSVTFMVMRSDGKEVMVDNNFLKANYPLLLINFYEQHLRYSPTSRPDQIVQLEA